jgi:hypothetical protein
MAEENKEIVEVTDNKVKKEKKPLTKKAKKMITVGVILAVIAGLLVGGICYINANITSVSNKLVIAFMPKPITGNDNNKEITFYIEENKDFDEENDEPIDAFNTYYYDDNGERVDLYQGQYKSSTADMQVIIGFFYMAQQNLNVFKNAMSIVLAVIILVAIAFCIYLWYRSWCKRQDKKQARLKQKN